jgi:eukaryotic-like serine/threonine-protein kinase
MTGQRLLHYEILDMLGQGGMGVVYKARDTHLDRFVAIKVLPAEKVVDPERKRRFVQEAKAASALHHSNIITIHDIAETDGLDYIVMEHVDGKTLDALIPRSGMRLAEALKIAIQIAGALAAAHAKGIVHRDLKPANVMVTPDGIVKILDFGLAKLTEPVSPSPDAETRTMKAPTEEGTILGTVAYMSPEQAEGKPVDARSDIFSFGALLYEMVTGRRAFRGDTKISTLSAVLHQEPKPLENVPHDLEKLITRCLRKDPDRRFQYMKDLKVELEDLKEESDSGSLAGTPLPIRPARRRLWFLTAGALALAAVTAVAFWSLKKSEPAALNLKIERFTFDPGLTFTPALSADGKLAAYSSDRSGDGNLDIYVQHTGGGQPSRLTRHEAADYEPSISPDGSKIAFRSDRDGGGIYLIDTLGGTERRLVAGGGHPAFSPDGSTIAYLSQPPSDSEDGVHIFLIPSQGGEPRQLFPGFGAGNPTTGSMGIFWSPDGKHLLFRGARLGDRASTDWWVAPIDGGAPVATGATKSIVQTVGMLNPIAWFGRHVYFCQGSLVEGIHLFRIPITANPWRISGQAERLTSGEGSTRRAAFALDGRMLFPSVTPGSDFWVFPLQKGKPVAAGAPFKATSDSTIKGHASLSRDGATLAYVAFVSWQTRRVELRLRSLSSGTESVYASNTFSTGVNPQISPDGSALAYADTVNGASAVFVAPIGNLPGKQVSEKSRVIGFLSDSRRLLIAGSARQVIRLDPATGSRTPVLDTAAPLLNLQFRYDVQPSPDDRWIAFTVNAPDGDLQVYVAPLGNTPAPEKDWIRIAGSTDISWSPRWSSDGNLLYLLSERDSYTCIWAQPLDPVTKRPAGAPVNVSHLHRAETSQAGNARSMFILSAPDKLIVPLWPMTGNLWMTRVDPK